MHQSILQLLWVLPLLRCHLTYKKNIHKYKTVLVGILTNNAESMFLEMICTVYNQQINDMQNIAKYLAKLLFNSGIAILVITDITRLSKLEHI